MDRLEIELDKFMASLGYGINAIERVDLKRIIDDQMIEGALEANDHFNSGHEAGYDEGEFDGKQEDKQDCRSEIAHVLNEFKDEISTALEIELKQLAED